MNNYEKITIDIRNIPHYQVLDSEDRTYCRLLDLLKARNKTESIKIEIQQREQMTCDRCTKPAPQQFDLMPFQDALISIVENHINELRDEKKKLFIFEESEGE